MKSRKKYTDGQREGYFGTYYLTLIHPDVQPLRCLEKKRDGYFNPTDVSSVFRARFLRVRIYSCMRPMMGECVLLRNYHGIVMRDSIYFVYSAEKCFHLTRPAEREKHVKIMEKEKWMENVMKRTETRGRARCSPQAFSTTKALNSTMRPLKRDNSRLSVNNDSFDSFNTNLPFRFRKCRSILKYQTLWF